MSIILQQSIDAVCAFANHKRSLGFAVSPVIRDIGQRIGDCEDDGFASIRRDAQEDFQTMTRTMKLPEGKLNREAGLEAQREV